ncbi:MAG: glycosyltransferase family 2 protein [Actinomycetia bacterium]|nr:glycosyltransferase family 2 protein [Actinomycetes bacterium]
MSDTIDLDPWSWAHTPDVETYQVPSPQTVTLVLVTHNASWWLADTLAAVDALADRPAAVVAVDTGSQDHSLDMLGAAAQQGRISRVLLGERDWSFGRAVAAALAQVPPTEWVWLLHDDAMPRPDALGQLLRQTALSPEADILVPMLLRPGRRRDAPRIQELGSSISHTGRRELGLEPGEVGQGQHDPARVLGGSTCGMLVRRSRLEQVGGFDEALPLYRDGQELGWRVTLAGGTVMTCPAARVVHRQAGRRGQRPASLAAQRGRTDTGFDRLCGMRAVLAHSRGPAAALVACRLVLGAVLRALGFLLGKRPDGAREELLAAGDLIRSGSQTRALRRKVAQLRAGAAEKRTVRSLRPHAASSWSAAADLVGRAVLDRARSLTGDEVGLDELTGDDFAGPGTTKAPSVVPVLAGVASLLLLVLAGRSLVGLGVVTSSGLLPAPASVAAAVESYVVPPAGGGEPAPWTGLAALASVVGIWPTWAAVLVLFLAVPIGAVAAAWCLRPLVASSKVRWAAAVGYGLLPVLVGGLSRGQVWLVAFSVLLAALGVALQSWQDYDQSLERLRPPALAALALTCLSAILPAAWVVVAVAIVVLVARRGRPLAAALTMLAPVVILAPWLLHLVRTAPGRLLTGPEPLLGSLDVVPAWQLFAGRSAGPGLAPLWLSAAAAALLWLVGVLAIGLDRRMLGYWGAALGLVLVAVGLSRLLVRLPGGLARPEVTPWLLAAFAALLAGAATVVDQARLEAARQSFGRAQALLAVMTVMTVVGLVLTAGWWGVGGAGEPTHRGAASSLPRFVQDSMEGPGRTRTLIVDLSRPQPRWWLSEAGGLTWGGAESVLGPADLAARDQVVTAVAQIASGRQSESLRDLLTGLGVGHVQVRDVSGEVTAALAATPGIARGGEENGVAVFTVLGKPTRLQLVGSEAVTPVGTEITTSGTGTLLLSEAADPRWQVSVGGRPLPRAESPDWRPAFALAGQTGAVEVSLRTGPVRPLVALAQLLGLVVLALFAAPSVRRENDQPVAGRRSAEEDL